MNGISPTIKSNRPTIRSMSLFSKFTQSEFGIDHKNMPSSEPLVTSSKVITLTLLHCLADSEYTSFDKNPPRVTIIENFTSDVAVQEPVDIKSDRTRPEIL